MTTQNEGDPIIHEASPLIRTPPLRTVANATRNSTERTTATSNVISQLTLPKNHNQRKIPYRSFIVGLVFFACLLAYLPETTNRIAGMVTSSPSGRITAHGDVRKALEQLDAEMNGHVVFGDSSHDDNDFKHAWRVWNAAAPAPYAVIEVSTAQDVQLAVRVLAKWNVPFTIKAGGHNYAGWSSIRQGIVLSVARLNSIQLEPNPADGTMIATVGPGTTVEDLLTHSLPQGYGGVVGSASSVGMGGFILGGGIGEWSREKGLGIDNLLSAQVVLADGTLVTASADEHADLFWALRGAGQTTLGVVTELKLKLYPAYDQVLTVSGSVPHHLAAAFMAKLGESDGLPRSISPELSSDGRELLMMFVCVGSDQATLVADQIYLSEFFEANLPLHVAKGFTFTMKSWIETTIEEAEDTEGLIAQNWNGFLKKHHSNEKNWDIIIEAFHEMMNSPYVIIDCELMSGAIGDVPVDSTAYAWRDGFYSVGVLVAVPATEKNAKATFSKESRRVESIWKTKISDLLDGTFPNYAMASLSAEEYPRLAWGDNLKRLEQIKNRYDPKNIFHSAIAIPTAKH